MLLNAVKQINQVYMQCGYHLTNLLMDGQFEPLRVDLTEIKIELNEVANDEDVPKIKQQIWMIKEQTCTTYCILPFKHVPHHLIIDMMFVANYWLNMFLHNDGISATLSQCTLVMGMATNYNHHCKLEFRGAERLKMTFLIMIQLVYCQHLTTKPGMPVLIMKTK